MGGPLNVRPSGALRSLLLLVALASISGSLAAAQQKPLAASPSRTIQVETRLVLVDVVVTDKKGKSVAKLTREDFALNEDGKPEQIAVFSWADAAQPHGKPPPLPANVYTNRPEYHPPREPLTIVLLDSLNTPRSDQAQMRKEIIRYLAASLGSDRWTAVLVLTDRLRVLQDFTTDRERLLAAVEKYTSQQSAPMGMREAVTSREFRDEIEEIREEIKAGCGELCGKMIRELQRFQAEALAATDSERAKRTLTALGELANAVLGYPGRKNLIWVSAAFPIFYRGSRHESAAGDELQQTVRLLDDARLAVYPVDPRGLIDAMQGESYAETVARIGTPAQQREPSMGRVSGLPKDDPGHPEYYLTMSQEAMKELAANTGGQAFYNRNDIGTAVALAVADGSSYYTLGYYPKNEKWDGSFRRIEVKVTHKGMHLRHRRGYYAVPAAAPVKQASQTASSDQIMEELQSALYDPLPATGLTFRAYVPSPRPAAISRVAIEFWLDKNTLQMEEQRGQARQLDLDFVVAAFSAEGKLVKGQGKRVRWSKMATTDYSQLLQSDIVLPTSIELPPGTYQLRLLLRDNRTGQLGRVDAPLVIPSLIASEKP